MRRRASVGAALLAGSVIVGGMVMWRTHVGHATGYRVSLLSVSPVATRSLVPDVRSCPSGGAGPGVKADEADGAPGSDLGAGQVIAYDLVVSATGAVPKGGEVDAQLSFGGLPDADTAFDKAAGVVCAFVDRANPATTAPAATAMATPAPAGDGAAFSATVKVRPLDPGQSAVAQIWVLAGTELSTDSGMLDARVDRLATPPGSRGEVSEADVSLNRDSSTARPEVSVSLTTAGGRSLQPGGPIEYTMRIADTSADTVANAVVVRFEPDRAVTVGAVNVVDSVGRTLQCARQPSAVTCTAPYLVPGETDTVVVSARVAPGAPTVFQGSGARCGRASKTCAHKRRS